jgi:hypothetical protein
MLLDLSANIKVVHHCWAIRTCIPPYLRVSMDEGRAFAGMSLSRFLSRFSQRSLWNELKKFVGISVRSFSPRKSVESVFFRLA